MAGIKDQAFGLELEFGGITRKKAAWAIKKALGVETPPRWVGGGYDKFTVDGPDGREWTIMRDSSVDEMGGQACEFVTPKCTYADIEAVQECIRALRRAGSAAREMLHGCCAAHARCWYGSRWLPQRRSPPCACA